MRRTVGGGAIAAEDGEVLASGLDDGGEHAEARGDLAGGVGGEGVHGCLAGERLLLDGGEAVGIEMGQGVSGVAEQLLETGRDGCAVEVLKR